MFTATFDTCFSSSQYINFYPYVGKDYASAHHKILVLGESHYGPQSNNGYHEWTRETNVANCRLLVLYSKKNQGVR